MSILMSRLITRRRALSLGAGLTGGLIATNSFAAKALAEDSDGSSQSGDTTPSEAVQHEIEQIIQAQGQTSDGVFSIEIDREDIPNVTLHGTPIKPSFQINGTLYFQKLDNDQVMMNSDLVLKANEIDPFLNQLISHDIVFQAEHQHLYDFSPMVWFIHFRAAGAPTEIAKGIKAALNATSTPFPQTLPNNPTTPLPAKQMGDVLGATPQIGADGVVNFNIPRAERIRLGGHCINPYLNVAAPVSFQPLDNSGRIAAAVPDFALRAYEVNKVIGLMRKQGWDIGCLYNQETDEHPQLYFSHQFKTGEPVQLAQEIRAGLNLTNSKFE